MPPEPSRAGFDSEWAWNDHYTERAKNWVRSDPVAALGVLAVKARVVFTSIAIVPHYRVTTGEHTTLRSGAEAWLTGAWLLAGRALGVVWIVLSVWLWVRGDGRARGVALVGVALPLSYVVPYVLGFGYERHFSIFVMLTTISLLFLLIEAARLRAHGSAAPSRTP